MPRLVARVRTWESLHSRCLPLEFLTCLPATAAQEYCRVVRFWALHFCVQRSCFRLPPPSRQQQQRHRQQRPRRRSQSRQPRRWNDCSPLGKRVTHPLRLGRVDFINGSTTPGALPILVANGWHSPKARVKLSTPLLTRECFVSRNRNSGTVRPSATNNASARLANIGSATAQAFTNFVTANGNSARRSYRLRCVARQSATAPCRLSLVPRPTRSKNATGCGSSRRQA